MHNLYAPKRQLDDVQVLLTDSHDNHVYYYGDTSPYELLESVMTERSDAKQKQEEWLNQQSQEKERLLQAERYEEEDKRVRKNKRTRKGVILFFDRCDLFDFII